MPKNQTIFKAITRNDDHNHDHNDDQSYIRAQISKCTTISFSAVLCTHFLSNPHIIFGIFFRILPNTMPPKKKGNKKANDDWEAELGESIDPIAAATQAAKDAETAQDVEAAQENQDDGLGGGGGLLAALKKNKTKKQKKGKIVDEDYLDGEDPPARDGVNGLEGFDSIENSTAKAPQEATSDDVFAAPTTKAKGGKGKQNKVEEAPKDDEDESDEEGGTLKSKKEREKEKREREKQRKKEQVAGKSWYPSCQS